jgi:hypothetical protein
LDKRLHWLGESLQVSCVTVVDLETLYHIRFLLYVNGVLALSDTIICERLMCQTCGTSKDVLSHSDAVLRECFTFIQLVNFRSYS